MSCVQFESLVNTEGFKTEVQRSSHCDSLRVLLIRKDSKLTFSTTPKVLGLRVLLIRKDSKQSKSVVADAIGLRVLLIRKDSKLCFCAYCTS